MDKRWIWDMEMYPNAFIICAKHTETGKRVEFQVSPIRDDRPIIADWLQNGVLEMVGFNSLFYDYPMLHYALLNCWNLRGRDFCSKMYKYSKSLIKGRKVYIKDKDYLRRQIDLFKINHFDNKSKMTSLKLLEFNLRMQNIQELPYDPHTVLTNEQIEEVISYCHNDVGATEELYVETLAEINLRDKMSPKYGIDFTNFNSSRMGESILISKIIEKLGETAVYDLVDTDYGVKRIAKKTKRDFINLNEVTFDYLSFTTKPFEAILKWFNSRVITETKGVFSKIPVEELEIIEGYYAVKKLKWDAKKDKLVLKNTVNTKNQLETLNILNYGFQYDFGVGGIHGSIEPGVYEESDTHELWDWDVASYYPNLAIKNEFYPAQYGPEFCPIYEGIYIERQGYPKKTHGAENLALKLALNGSYGKSNSEYSPLYDPMYTMKTTINGQLLLCMLSERFMEEIPDCQMIQINTDGMTIRLHKDYVPLMKEICARWEALTKLELESAIYSKMIIKDVNNYIAVSTSGYIKRKGAAFIYKVQPGELELHKNFSNLVVPKALEAYFVNGVEPEKFIRDHDDVYDFFKRTKINRSDKLLSRVYDDKNNVVSSEEIQRITRYYISGSQHYDKESKTYSNVGTGTTLIKQMPPLKNKKALEKRALLIEGGMTAKQADIEMIRYNNVEAGCLCSYANDMNKENVEHIKQNINYDYYINEVYKVINMINHNGKK